jgi:citrate lyase beta subunit
MRWSISLRAEGDRPMERAEIVELADAVAPYSGIATGIGTNAYAAQIVVEAATSEDALAHAKELFAAAAARAGLPAWPTVWTDAISEESDLEGFV